jgi:hypothetical protein
MDTPEWMKNYVPNPPGNPSWKKGGPSPNPLGRPKNVLDRRYKITKVLQENAEQVAKQVIDAALEGDLQACQIVLSRVAPALKARAETVSFTLDPNGTLTENAKNIMVAISEGSVDPDTGKMLMECLSTLQGITQIDELATRMAELEAALLGRQT